MLIHAVHFNFFNFVIFALCHVFCRISLGDRLHSGYKVKIMQHIYTYAVMLLPSVCFEGRLAAIMYMICFSRMIRRHSESAYIRQVHDNVMLYTSTHLHTRLPS